MAYQEGKTPPQGLLKRFQEDPKGLLQQANQAAEARKEQARVTAMTDGEFLQEVQRLGKNLAYADVSDAQQEARRAQAMETASRELALWEEARSVFATARNIREILDFFTRKKHALISSLTSFDENPEVQRLIIEVFVLHPLQENESLGSRWEFVLNALLQTTSFTKLSTGIHNPLLRSQPEE